MSQMPASPIFDQSYQPWEGKLNAPAWGILALIKAQALNTFRRYTASIIVLGGLVLFLTGLPAAFLLMNPGVDPALAGAALIYAEPVPYGSVPLTLALMLPLVVGGMIASDAKHNALLMYFSKSIRRVDYLVGKIAAAFVLLAGPVIFAPLLAVSIATFNTGPMATAAPPTLYVMRLMLAMVAITFILSWGYLLSLNQNILHISRALLPDPPAALHLMHARNPDSTPMTWSPWISAAILAGVTVLSLFVVMRRLADAETRA
ncbi:MAG: hypothetical protein K8T20_12360 [Planctomycetes bacterium]|nr:hypothetical protein [Planctomycetota bacterium]